MEQKTIEINNLQRKISSLKSRLQANEKNQKAQKEHLSKLENKLIENAQKLGGSVNLEELKNQLVSSNSKKIEVLHGYNETLKNLHFKNKLDSRVAIDEFVRLKTGPTIKVKIFMMIFFCFVLILHIIMYDASMYVFYSIFYLQ